MKIILSMKKVKNKRYIFLFISLIVILSGIGFFNFNSKRQSINKQRRYNNIIQKEQDNFEESEEEYDVIYQTDNYVIYKEETAIVVEGKKEADNFFWKEHINYFDLGPAIDVYLCDKNGKKTESEKDAYLYVDFGNLGEWWCDPFGNLNSDLQVDAEFISDELIEKIQKKILESWHDADIREMKQNTGIIQLTLQELKERIPENTLDEIFEEFGEWQDYYEVDFDNDGKKDIVVSNGAGMGRTGYGYHFFYKNEDGRSYQMTFGLSNTMSISKPLNFDGKNYWMQVLSNGDIIPGFDYAYCKCNIYYFENGCPIELVSLTFDPQVVNSILCGETGQEKLEVGMTVKKKFINDFINMSYGPW